MAANLQTPVDSFSGLPLPLMPTRDVLPIDNGGVANWHHHFHPSSDPALTSSAGGRALRSSRIQLVPVQHHNYSDTAYHRFYEGPPIPTERGEQFGMCVLSCAGYIPDRAIDVSTGAPEVRLMSEDQISHLRMVPEPQLPGLTEVERFRDRHLPGASLETADESLTAKRIAQARLSFRHLRYGYDPMKQFFSEVVLAQDVSHLRPAVRNKFISRGDETQGLSLLAIAARQAVETITPLGMTVEQLYQTAQADGRLHDDMPRTAASLVKYKLGDVQNRLRLLPELRRQLLGESDQRAG